MCKKKKNMKVYSTEIGGDKVFQETRTRQEDVYNRYQAFNDNSKYFPLLPYRFNISLFVLKMRTNGNHKY